MYIGFVVDLVDYGDETARMMLQASLDISAELNGTGCHYKGRFCGYRGVAFKIYIVVHYLYMLYVLQPFRML